MFTKHKTEISFSILIIDTHLFTVIQYLKAIILQFKILKESFLKPSAISLLKN